MRDTQPGRPGSGPLLAVVIALFFDALLRMRVKLQNDTLVVAGSSPAGPIQGDRSSGVEHAVSPILVAAGH